jgi:hypothetical protein
VKQVRGFFNGIRYRVAGRELTLNEIEEQGRALGDWRIHFAVVCASSSCPPLRAEAYVPDRLDAQLAEQTRQFLQDPARGLRLDRGALWVSKIFDWYREDFEPPESRGGRRHRPTATELVAVLTPYLNPKLVQSVERVKPTLKFFIYDWALNDQRQ